MDIISVDVKQKNEITYLYSNIYGIEIKKSSISPITFNSIIDVINTDTFLS